MQSWGNKPAGRTLIRMRSPHLERSYIPGRSLRSRCGGGRNPSAVDVAAPAPAVGLRPELPLQLHQAPDPGAVGADVGLDVASQPADGGQVDAEQLRALLQRRRDRPAQVQVVPGPHRTSVSNTRSRMDRERCVVRQGSAEPELAATWGWSLIGHSRVSAYGPAMDGGLPLTLRCFPHSRHSRYQPPSGFRRRCQWWSPSLHRQGLAVGASLGMGHTDSSYPDPGLTPVTSPGRGARAWTAP
jgi:hypothetical protein